MNEILRTARDRIGPILLVVLMAVLVGSPSPVAAGSEPSCDLDPSTGRLDVTVPAGWVVGLHRDQAGVILMNDAACGRATVTNVDRIRVVGDEGLQWLQIDLANGGFAPGKTNEPGDSDEVEFTILLGTGGDRIIVSGTSGPDRIRLGWTGSPIGMPTMNLNADEATGIDSDVGFTYVGSIAVYGYAGGDHLSGDRRAGTGAAIPSPLHLYGKGGPDTLVGGTAGDLLIAGAGVDMLKGGNGPDLLDAFDGNGDDTVDGGNGQDECDTDPGDTVISC